jgi:hypothetical protein
MTKENRLISIFIIYNLYYDGKNVVLYAPCVCDLKRSLFYPHNQNDRSLADACKLQKRRRILQENSYAWRYLLRGDIF